jgi:uncharacterized membrane protein YkgB
MRISLLLILAAWNTITLLREGYSPSVALKSAIMTAILFDVVISILLTLPRLFETVPVPPECVPIPTGCLFFD